MELNKESFLDGHILLIDKPYKWSSFQALNSVKWTLRKAFSLKKIKKKALDRIEKEVISFVLDKTGWNRTKAASILKVSYKTLLYKINDLHIRPPAK